MEKDWGFLCCRAVLWVCESTVHVVISKGTGDRREKGIVEMWEDFLGHMDQPEWIVSGNDTPQLLVMQGAIARDGLQSRPWTLLTLVFWLRCYAMYNNDV